MADSFTDTVAAAFAQSQDVNTSDFKSAAWKSQDKAWQMVSDLWESPLYIREQGQKYLEKFKKEQPEKYEERRSRSVPRNKFRESLESMAGMVFKADPAPTEAPQAIKDLFTDIDACGNSLHSFLIDAFERLLRDGGGAIWVNASPLNETARTKAQKGETLTAADREGDRPWWVFIEAKQIINYRYEKVNGMDVLTQITIECTETEPSGEFGEQQVTRHYILRRGSTEVRRKNDKGEWVKEADKGGDTGLKEIPLIPLGKFGAAPPLLDLAMLTVQYYNKESDFDNWCHYACVPRQITKLPDESAVDKFKKVRNANPDAGLIIFGEHSDAFYLEVTGKGLEIVVTRLETLDQRMAAIGVGLLAPTQIAPKTATEVIDTAGQRQSKLARYAREFENVVEKAFYITGEVLQMIRGIGAIDLKEFENASLKLKMDFDRLTFDADQMKFFTDLRTTGNLSLETFWQMVGRVWDMPEGWSPELEKQRLASEPKPTPEPPVTPLDAGSGKA
jgi:hypothetical protein